MSATIKPIRVTFSVGEQKGFSHKMLRFSFDPAYSFPQVRDFLLIRSEMDANREVMTVSAYLVNSPGPILGFMGYFLDVETGYLLASDSKRSEYIPFLDLYSYLRSKGIAFSKESFYNWLVNMKLGVLDSNSFPTALTDFSGVSVTSILLGSRFGGFQKSEFTMETLMDELGFVTERLGRGILYGRKGDVLPEVPFAETSPPLGQAPGGYAYDLVSEFERQQEGASLLPLSVRELMERSKFIVLNFYQEKAHPNLSSEDLFMAVSALSVGSTAALPTSKSGYLAMNLYDIADSLDKRDLVEGAVENPGEVVGVVEKVGLDAYLTGRRKSSIITGLRDTRFREILPTLGSSRYSVYTYLKSVAAHQIPVAYQFSFDAPLFKRALSRVLAIIS